MDLQSKRILITGSSGFLGRHLVDLLQHQGCTQLALPRRSQYDLTKEAAIQRLYLELKPEIVIHLAATVGGIGANQANPGKFFYENLIMGTQLMEYARLNGVEKFVTLGTICAYPKFTPVPFKEESLWDGYPEETNAPYGLAKKMLLVQSQAYRQEYGFNAIYLLPINLYGPGDNFDPFSSHVIPALIRKCLEAIRSHSSEIVCWGDGSPTREFLYVKDCAQAVVQATQTYNEAFPINIGPSLEISIKDLAELITQLTGFTGKIVWDQTKPNGQPRRAVDITRAKQCLNFAPKTSFYEGLQKTIAWAKARLEL